MATLYQSLIKPMLFQLGPEEAHQLTFRMMRTMLNLQGVEKLLDADQLLARDPLLRTQAFGLSFPNPVGLAAGLDKNAQLIEFWGRLGFGFVEVGTITPLPQPGNPKPRLFRLPADEALINRMGFNNDGMEAIAQRLEKRPEDLILGVNIGKNKVTPNEEAAQDYLKCFRRLHHYADYFVVNVSSPNTPGLRQLQDRDALTQLLELLQNENQRLPTPRPILLKIAPDLTDEQVLDTVSVVRSTGIQGLVATNTTIDRSGLTTPAAEVEKIGAGGLSGKPLTSRSRQVVGLIAGQGVPVMGVGGIMDAPSAEAMFAAGATLVQVYSGFIYEGPALVRDILMERRRRLLAASAR